MILLWSAVLPSRAGAQGPGSTKQYSAPSTPSQNTSSLDTPAITQIPSIGTISAYEGKSMRSIEISNVIPTDRDHLLQLLPQRTGEPLSRGKVRDSLRVLYGTGRFAD